MRKARIEKLERRMGKSSGLAIAVSVPAGEDKGTALQRALDAENLSLDELSAVVYFSDDTGHEAVHLRDDAKDAIRDLMAELIARIDGLTLRPPRYRLDNPGG